MLRRGTRFVLAAALVLCAAVEDERSAGAAPGDATIWASVFRNEPGGDCDGIFDPGQDVWLAGVVVHVFPVDPPGAGLWMETDALGQAVFEGLELGVYVVGVDPEQPLLLGLTTPGPTEAVVVMLPGEMFYFESPWCSPSGAAPDLDLLVNGQPWEACGVTAPIPWVSRKSMEFAVRGTDADAGDALTVTGTLDGVPLEPSGGLATLGAPTGTNPVDRAFAWLPGPLEAGVHELAFQVDDGTSQATCSFLVEVVDDTDGDAIADHWEQEQGYWAANGEWVPLEGADWQVPDIFVYMDYLEGEDHTHRPSQAALDMVADAFLAHGVVVHLVLAEEGIPESEGLQRLGQVEPDPTVSSGSVYLWGDLDVVKEAHRPPHIRAPYHYCLWAHEIPSAGGSSLSYGISRGSPGADFIVAYWTGEPLPDHVQASVFMHELGHNLGLRHGGGDDVPYKPNYLSVMNYLFAHTGLIYDGTFGHVAYSDGSRPPLYEGALDEAAGLGPTAAGYGTRWWIPFGFGFEKREATDASEGVDWNGNEAIDPEPVPADVNKDGEVSEEEPLEDHDDPEGFEYDGASVGSWLELPLVAATEHDEIDVETAVLISPLGNVSPDLTPLGMRIAVRDRLAGWPLPDDRKGARRIAKAVKHLDRANTSALWADPHTLGRKGGRVFEEDQKAVKDLMKVESEAGRAAVGPAIEDLLHVDRTLAEDALQAAVAAGGRAHAIAKAEKEMAKAEADVAEGAFDEALDHYGKAWKWARKALRDLEDD